MLWKVTWEFNYLGAPRSLALTSGLDLMTVVICMYTHIIYGSPFHLKSFHIPLFLYINIKPITVLFRVTCYYIILLSHTVCFIMALWHFNLQFFLLLNSDAINKIEKSFGVLSSLCFLWVQANPLWGLCSWYTCFWR